MMGITRCTAVAALAALLSVSTWTPSAAQDPVPEPAVEGPADSGVFGTFGLGVASAGVGGLLSLSLHRSRNVFILRTSGASEFTLFGSSDSSEDYALLFGRVRDGRSDWARAAVGPAVVRTRRRGQGSGCSGFFCSGDTESTTTVGLALQADVVWALGPAVGLGLTAFGSVNPQMSYGGLALGLHLGRVRRR
jgi:hypothetical protein